MKIIPDLESAGNNRYGQLIRGLLNNPLYRNSIFLMANTVITSGLGFFYWIIVARLYTAEEVGIGSAAIAVMNILSFVSFVGLNDALIRFLPKAERPERMINSSLTLTGGLSLVISIIFFAGIDLWSPALAPLRGSIFTWVSLILLVLTATVSGILESVFVAGRRSDFVLWKNTLTSVFKIPLAALFVLFYREFGIASSWMVAAATAVFISLVWFAPRVNKGYKFTAAIDRNLLSGLMPYAAGSYVVLLVDSVAQFVLPIIVLNRAGPAQNAYFYVVFMIANLLFAIPWAASRALFAEGSHFEEGMGKRLNEAFRFSFVLLIPGIILVLLLGEWLLGFFGGTYAQNGSFLLSLLAASGLFTAINTIYTSILRVQNRIKEMEIIFLFKSMATLVGSFILIPMTGIAGVGYVWLAVQGIFSIYVFFAIRPIFTKKT